MIWGRDLAAGMAGGLAGIGGIQREKQIVKCLNDSLDSCLERVRSLEADNWRLESNIQEHLEKGRLVRDWGHYSETIEDMRAQILARSVDNAYIDLQIDNDPNCC